MVPVQPLRAWHHCAVMLAIVAGALLGVFACATEAAHAATGPHATRADPAAGHHVAMRHVASRVSFHDVVSDDMPGSAHSSHGSHGTVDAALEHQPSGPVDSPLLHDGHANLACLSVIELAATALSRTNCVANLGEPAKPAPPHRSAPPEPPVPKWSASS